MKNPRWLKKIKFLCFDLDGTLFRQVESSWNAIQEQIYETVIRHRNLSLTKAQEYVKSRYHALGSSTKVLNELGIDGREFFVEAFEKVDLNQLVSKDQRLVDLIDRLRKRYTVGMISNTHRSIAKKKLEAIGLSLDSFRPLVTTYELGVYKPDPAPFLKTLELAGVSAEESVFIGDSIENDILGAKGVGMHTVLVWSNSAESDLSIECIYDLERAFL